MADRHPIAATLWRAATWAAAVAVVGGEQCAPESGQGGLDVGQADGSDHPQQDRQADQEQAEDGEGAQPGEDASH